MTTKAVDVAPVEPDAPFDPFVDPWILWVPAALNQRRVVAFGINFTGSPAWFWGDGSQSPGGAGAARHTYAKAGAYTVTAKDGETVIATVQVFIRDGLGPDFALAIATDNPQIVELTINDEPADIVSDYQITWGVGGPTETVTLKKGAVRAHGFEPGTHTVTVRDLHTGRTLAKDTVVAAPTFDPDFSIAKGADINTALLTITKLVTPGKDLLVDWGDGKSETIAAAADDAKVSHPYPAAGTYGIQVLYADNSTDGKGDTVTIPFPARDKGIGRP